METIQLHLAEPDDLPQLLCLLEKLFAIEEDFRCSAERQRRGLEMLLASQTAAILVAKRDDRIVGMVTGQLVISTAEGAASLLIEDLVVAEEARGVGVGKRLLEEIGGWGNMHGASRMQLLADRNNTSALGFYNSCEWRPTQLICLRKYYHQS